jgi:predicted O-methyltransferase YrrM
MTAAPLKIYFYEAGRDFEYPAEVIEKRGAPQGIPLLAGMDGPGDCPEGSFVRVADADAADFLVFPYLLEPIIGVRRTPYAHFLLRSLPHFTRLEDRHAIFNFHDRGQPLLTTALVVTDDPRRSNRDDPHVACFPHFPARHVVEASPSLDFDKIRYDVCFVGTLSDPIRVGMINSIAAEKGLRSFLRHPNTLDWSDPATSYLHMKDEEKRRELETVYVQNARKSWAMLCPRGMGSSSIRFYEALCLGRIPVHISDEYVFPLEGRVDFSRFTIDIRQDDVPVMGKLLAAWFRKKSPEELAALCREARAAYEEHLQEHHSRRIAVEILRRRLAQRNAEPQAAAPRYVQVPDALLGAPARTISADPCRYARLEPDDGALWLNKGFRLRKSPLDPNGVMNECNGVSGYLPPQDIEFLFSVAAELPMGGTLVEIGSWMGLSAITMANALYARRNMDGRIYCVDTWLGSAEHQDFDFIRRDEMYQRFLSNLRTARADLVAEPVRAPSLEAAERFADGSIDILFIDGDHSYEACLDDMLHWIAKVRPGGLVIGHDCYEEPDNGVFRATRKFTEITGIAVSVVPGLRMFRFHRPLNADLAGIAAQPKERQPVSSAS